MLRRTYSATANCPLDSIDVDIVYFAKSTLPTSKAMRKKYLGEFEQMVLLALLQLGEQAYALGVREELERCAARTPSRGALYRTFDRLEAKGFLEWDLEESAIPERGGHPMRRLRVTQAGVEALRESRTALLKLWDGLESRLEEPR